MASSQDVFVKKAYYDTKQGQLHCRISRPLEQQPALTRIPILLLHLASSSSKSCVALMQRLSGLGFSCFAPDMPGFGESFNPKDDPPSIEWYSSMYHDVFSNVPEFQHGCHIIGHHSGAVIGTDFAARYPGVVESLTLVGPAVLTPEERKKMAQKTMDPFNTPVDDGSHLKRTKDYLIENGIPANNRDLLHREVLDHARAWRGRMQIYACVWAYDCAASMQRIEVECKMLAMCALDDVLWPMFKNVESVGRGIRCEEINGANFEPDLAPDEIVKHFLALIGATDVL